MRNLIAFTIAAALTSGAAYSQDNVASENVAVANDTALPPDTEANALAPIPEPVPAANAAVDASLGETADANDGDGRLPWGLLGLLGLAGLLGRRRQGGEIERPGR